MKECKQVMGKHPPNKSNKNPAPGLWLIHRSGFKRIYSSGINIRRLLCEGGTSRRNRLKLQFAHPFVRRF